MPPLQVSHVKQLRRWQEAQRQELLASIRKKTQEANTAREARIAALQERFRNHVSGQSGRARQR